MPSPAEKPSSTPNKKKKTYPSPLQSIEKSETNDSSCSVKVYCRVRPANQLEFRKGGKQCVDIHEDSTSIDVSVNEDMHTFTFDHVFQENDDQELVFNTIARPVVHDVMEGYNATIFAYGQTSSGKTYTMEGASIDDQHLKGIIPRAAGEIFTNVLASDENMEFVVKVSYVEIYMERIRDLLDPYKTKVNLQIREDAKKGIYVAGVTEICVTTDEELLGVMRDGATNRAVAATGMNEGSSRSHSVFMVTIAQRHVETEAKKVGKLVLVDLAGSEMVRKTGASGQQLEEAKMINKSLSALGQVINALTDSNVTHIPYRDSKLTRVLQESIGGNARTALIINVSPSSFNASETLSTLRFGNRAKTIKNKAVVNEELSVTEFKVLLASSEAQIQKQQAQILALEAQLLAKASTETVPSEVDTDASDATAQLKGTENVPDVVSLDVNVVIQNLENQITKLENDLADERDDLKVKADEIASLTRLLHEKDAMFKEKEKEVTAKFETKLFEMENQSSELLQSYEEKLQESKMETEHLHFKLDELNLHSHTLEGENKKLAEEIESLSAVVRRGSVESVDAKDSQNKDLIAPPSPADSGSKTENTTSPGAESTVPPAAPASLTEKEGMKQLRSSLSEQLTAEKAQWERKLEAFEKEKRRLLELSDQKDSQIEQLEKQLETMITPGHASSDSKGISVKDRKYIRSVEQKLEQLVIVHRKLLRKYASLELEMNEATKKLSLREERIQQLENNTRMLAGNMRTQAERHVGELTRLRDQITQLRNAQTGEYESAEKSKHDRIASKGRGIANDTGVIRPIRGGGGGRITSLKTPPVPKEQTSSGGFLSRFFS